MSANLRHDSKFVVAVLALSLSACHGKADAPATQIAAKVNREEISVHQINNALSNYGNLPEAEIKQIRSQILEKLIDRDLLVQKALDDKLDRDPRIMQALESARRQVLAQAYLERATANVPKPSAQEIKIFYVEHPQLFAERRIYRTQELALAAREMPIAELQNQVSKAKSINDIATWLKSRNVKFKLNGAIKAAEQLPLELLPTFHAAKDGQMFILPSSNNAIVVVQLEDSQTAPLSEQEAAPYVEQFLQNQFRTKLAEKELKELRDTAKVEYKGEFENRASAPVGAAPATADASQKDFVERGISGMK